MDDDLSHRHMVVKFPGEKSNLVQQITKDEEDNGNNTLNWFTCGERRLLRHPTIVMFCQSVGRFAIAGTFKSSQSKCNAFDRELLAAYAWVNHITFNLQGRKFVLYTDH